LEGYKGFNQDLKCRDFQFEIGKEYEEEKAIACETGFHFCENPLDVFNYYPPVDSRYCKIEADGQMDKRGDDSKVACTKIHIGLELGLPGLISAGVKFIMEHIKWDEAKESNTGDQSAATNTGDQSAATNTGYKSAATNTGYKSAATNTGDQSAATNTGDQSAATNTGYKSAATNTGDYSAATNTGDQSAATNTGDYSAATNTGNYSAATVEGQESVASSLGIEGKAKGALGCWLVLAEWYRDDNYDWHRKDVQCVKVDGEIIKADTFYILKAGQFVECVED